MHPNPRISDSRLVHTRALLFVGFDHNIDGSVRNFPHQIPDYQCLLEQNSFLAYLWLEKRVGKLDTYQLPFAVICDLDWLIQDQYHLAQQMRVHPDLCTVPLIVLAKNATSFDLASLTANGVDDCYRIPVDWYMLEKRVEFLNQFKPRLLEASDKVKQEEYVFRIPLAKRIFDLVGASLAILLSIWIWLPVMIAIRLESKGPVIYRSKRVGFGYHVFDFFKFRSMCVGAEEGLTQISHLNQYSNGAESGKPIFVKISGDPRTTRVGRFIRKYSMDELPQLINVLMGDMSLVGNRPLPVYEAETLTRDAWSERFLAPAGITGLWHVSKKGRPDMTAEERIGLDITYAKKGYSMVYDLKIALMTFLVLVQKEEI
jgi:lipopolysaccharide/colanic/teichoic acid biosynthesis glycosyltransferase